METGGKVTPDELIAEMHRTVDRLAEDGADRGDIRILARALRELRHSIRVLSEHRGVRKVTVFGSARCPPDPLPTGRRRPRTRFRAGSRLIPGSRVGRPAV